MHFVQQTLDPPTWPSAWKHSEFVSLSANDITVHYTGRLEALLGPGNPVLFGDAISVTANAQIPIEWFIEWESRHKLDSQDNNATPAVTLAEIYYFEVQPLALILGGSIAIGVSTRPGPVHVGSMPGWVANSYGFHSDGEVFSGAVPSEVGRGRAYGPTFGVNDVVGCGLRISTGEIFFTVNGYVTVYLCIYVSTYYLYI
jgi:hypothetical protein